MTLTKTLLWKLSITIFGCCISFMTLAESVFSITSSSPMVELRQGGSTGVAFTVKANKKIDKPLIISHVTINSSDANVIHSIITNTCIGSLAAGSSCTVVTSLTAQTTATTNATLDLTVCTFNGTLCSGLANPLTIKRSNESVKEKWQQTMGPTGGLVQSLTTNPFTNELLAMTTGGLYKSIDNGDNWTVVGLRGKSVRDVSIVSKNLIYAVTTSGIYKTTDGGTNWVNIDNNLSEQVNSSSPKINALDANNIIVGLSSGLFKSTNGGDSWQDIAPDLTGDQRVVFSMFVSDANNIIIGTASGIFRTQTGGGDNTNWTDLSSNLADPNSPPYSFWWSMAVEAVNNNINAIHIASQGIIAKRTNLSPGSDRWAAQYIDSFRSIYLQTPDLLYAGTTRNGLLKSIDAGDTWQPTALTKYQIRGVYVSEPNTVFAGANNQGVLRSLDGGATAFTHKNNSLIATHISSLATIDGATLYAASNIGQGVYKSTDGGNNWSSTNTNSELFGVASLAMVNNDLVYVGNSGSVYKTVNGGLNWVLKNNNLPVGTVNSLISLDSQTVLAAMQGGIYKTIDGAEKWIPKNTGLDVSLNYQDIFKLNNTDLFTIAYLYDYGSNTFTARIYKSLDQGENWQDITGNFPQSPTIETYNRLRTILAINSNIIYVGTQHQGIFKTIDGGANWQRINNGLAAKLNVNNIISESATVLYAATTEGVYKTINGGENWQAFNNGFLDVDSYAYTLLMYQNQLWGAAWGAGVYKTV